LLLCAAGAKVTDTIRKGIIDIEPYENSTEVLMVGNVAALTGNLFSSAHFEVPLLSSRQF